MAFLPSSPYLTHSPLTLNTQFPTHAGHYHSGATSPATSIVDNFIHRAESLAGTPGHGLLQGKARTKGAAVYHSASSILGPSVTTNTMMNFGIGSMSGSSSAPLPFPSASSYIKKGK